MRAVRLARAPRRTLGSRRLAVLTAVVATLFLTLGARAAQLQVLDPRHASAAANALATRTVVVPAVRGRILARDGTPIVDNTAAAAVTVRRATLLGQADGGRALLARVASAVHRPVEEVWGRAYLCGTVDAPPAPVCWGGSAYVPIPVATDVDPLLALGVAERPATFPGVEVVATPVRRNAHPGGANLAHVVGYLGRATGPEVTASHGAITDEDLVGRAGLEAEYDAVLRGTPGRVVVAVDPRGVVVRELSRVDPVPGADLRTNIDLAVQVATERSLASQVAAARRHGERADSAAAVVLDVRTGGVVASASWPTYDPQVWTGGISERAYAALTAPKASTPLLDRVTAVTGPPASTFKVVSVPAAVAAGNPLTGTYDCTSAYRIGNRDFHNFESRSYGPISMTRVIEISCDTVFYGFAYRSWLAHGGLAARTDTADPFVAWARAYGLGARTGIDLPGEVRGRIPDRSWKRAVWEETRVDLCRRARTGYPEVARTDASRAAYLTSLARENCTTGWQYRGGDAANFAIGQGDVSATPLQMAVAYGAIANGGTLVVPRVAAGTVADGRVRPLPAVSVRPRVPFAPSMLAFLHTALRAVVERGTAASAFAGMPADWPVAGKTGTGEVFGKGDTAWFVSYAPSTAPRWSVAVTISQGGTGGTFAATAARGIHLALRSVR